MILDIQEPKQQEKSEYNRRYRQRNKASIIEREKSYIQRNKARMAKRDQNKYLQQRIFSTLKIRPCECGCGELVRYGNKFIQGHGGPKVAWPSYEKTREIIKGLNIPGKDKFLELSKQGRLPKGIPRDPHDTYKNKGWISWPDFLGYEPKFTRALPFKEARKIARTLGCKSSTEYYNLYREGKLPKGLPHNLKGAYKDEWTYFSDFLGYTPKYIRPESALSFEEARKVTRLLGLRSYKEYHDLYKQGRLPKGLPYSPNVYYKDKGWTSIHDFLGYEPRTKPLPFKEARKTAQSLDIKSGEKYQDLHKEGKLPKGLPVAPDITYRNKGWTNWYEFLGNEPYTKPLPFKDAREIIRKSSIKGKEEYQRLHTQGKLPKGLPYEPQVAYSKEKRESIL